MKKPSIPPTLRGLLSVFGATLIFFVAGSFHGSFGNMLPYFSSYKRQFDPSLTNGDLSVILSTAGFAQGFSYLLAGSVLIPLFGSRRCLFIGCSVYLMAPLLSYLVIDQVSLIPFAICYGGLSGCAVNLIVIPVMLIPVSWFPNSKGKVVGCVNAGMGLSSMFFTPLQTYIINPENIAAVKGVVDPGHNASTSVYFTSKELIHRIPVSLLYLAGIYATLFSVGFVLCIEKTDDKKGKEKEDLDEDAKKTSYLWKRIRSSFQYLWTHGLRNRDFYLLFSCRFLSQVVCSALIGYYKTFCLEIVEDDRMISIIGGGNGILNAVSRFLAGALIDRLPFNRLFPAMYLTCSGALAAIYWVGHVSFPGLVALLWTIYLLAFTHFTTVPTQAIRLFDSEHSSIILGGIGLADTLAYGSMSLMSYSIFTGSTPMPFFIFFSCLSVFACFAAVVAFFVRISQHKADEHFESELGRHICIQGPLEGQDNPQGPLQGQDNPQGLLEGQDNPQGPLEGQDNYQGPLEGQDDPVGPLEG